MIRKASRVSLSMCGLFLAASLASPVAAQGTLEKITGNRIVENGEKVDVDFGSSLGPRHEVVVNEGELHIRRGLAKAGTAGRGKIKLRSNKAKLVIEGGNLVDADIELSLGATLRLVGDQATIVGGKITNDRTSKIYLEGANALAVGDSLVNDGDIYVDNHLNTPTGATNQLSATVITNRGHIKIGAAGMGTQTTDGVRLGTIYGAVTNETGGEIEVRLPKTVTAMAPARVAATAKRMAYAPAPSTAAAYVTVTGSLATGGTLTIAVDNSFYGQFLCPVNVTINGATLNVNSATGTSITAGTKLDIVKAPNILGTTGFTTSNYTGPVVFRAHSLAGVYQCTATRKCYPLTVGP